MASIDIVVKEKGATISGATAEGSSPTSVVTPQAGVSKSTAKAAVVGIMLGKNVASYITSNIGKYTGNTQSQTNVNNAITLSGMGMGIAMNPTLGIANAAFQLATQAFDLVYERSWERKEMTQARARAGYTNESISRGRR